MREKPFNEPLRSPHGCLMGSTEGKNTTDTIMQILKSTTKQTTIKDYEELGTLQELQVMKEKMNAIQEVLKNYEKTFDWGCNDSVHPAVAHAIYGIVNDKDFFLEEYQELIKEIK